MNTLPVRYLSYRWTSLHVAHAQQNLVLRKKRVSIPTRVVCHVLDMVCPADVQVSRTVGGLGLSTLFHATLWANPVANNDFLSHRSQAMFFFFYFQPCKVNKIPSRITPLSNRSDRVGKMDIMQSSLSTVRDLTNWRLHWILVHYGCLGTVATDVDNPSPRSFPRLSIKWCHVTLKMWEARWPHG